MKPPRPRGGFTLVELLTAIVLTAIVGALVGQWIVHEVRARVSSDRRIDAVEAVVTLRGELFQDVHHGRILSLSKESWTIVRPSLDAASDSVVWTLKDGAISRRASGLDDAGRLLGFSDVRVAWEPVAVPGFSGMGANTWWSLDVDQNGRIEGDELDSVLSVAVHILAEYRTVPGLPMARESLTVAIPAAGL